MKIGAIKPQSYNFKGFSDDLKKARLLLQDNAGLDGYLKDGKTVIIEKVEINNEEKSAHENLKKVGQGAAAGIAGGATGTVLAKRQNNSIPTDDTPDEVIITQEFEPEIQDTVANAQNQVQDTANILTDEDFAEITEEMEFDADTQEAATGIFGAVKSFFKSLLDID